MAQTPQPEETGTAGESTTGAGRAQGLFSSATTILLLVFAVAVFWWSRRRRIETEEQLMAQRREAEASAERSAVDVAHLMRSAPRATAAAAPTRQGSPAAGEPESGEVAEPTPRITIDDGTDVAASAVDLERGHVTTDQDEALAREIERRQARAAADRSADEQIEHAMQSSQSESFGGRSAAISTASEDAAVAAGDGAQLGHIPDAVNAVGAAPGSGRGAQGVVRDQRPDTSVPAGAIVGDGAPVCPPDFPIKGNRQSRIYHRPGQASYPSTIAEFCFASEAAAEAAGYRPSRARGQRPQAG